MLMQIRNAVHGRIVWVTVFAAYNSADSAALKQFFPFALVLHNPERGER